MEEQLQNKKEEKYSSNQEEGFMNPKLLRLGSPIPTPTDQESPIMFSDSMEEDLMNICNVETLLQKEKYSKQEEGLCEQGKEIDPSFMKEAYGASSIDDERSSNSTTLLDNVNSSVHDQKKFVGGDYSAAENSQKAMCASSKKRKHVMIDGDPEAAASFKYSKKSPNSSQASPFIDISSSFALSGSFSSPEPPSAAAVVIRNQTSSCPSSNAAYLGRSNSFPSYFYSLQEDKSSENAAAIPNQKSKSKKNPSNSPSYFGKSRSLSSYFFDEDSPSSSSPCFLTASLPTTTDDVHKSDDEEKPIIIVDQKDDENGGSVLAAKANTEVSSVGVHSINDLSWDLINKLISYLPAQEAAVIPILSKALYETCAVDSKLIRSWIPLWLEVDCERLSSCLSFSNINPYRERERIMVFFLKALLKALKALHRLIRLHLRGEGTISSYMLSLKFGFLKHLHLFEVQIGKGRCRGIDIGCLEVLEMEHCQIPSYFELGNGGGNLKVLIMQRCSALGGGEHIMISINLPTLLTFRYHGHLSHFDISKSGRLAELHLRFIVPAELHLFGTNNSLKDYWGDQNLVYCLLNSVKDRIQILHICDLCLQNAILTRHSQLLPVAFPQVTELYLTISFKKDVLTNLAGLLRRSVPRLIKLFITVTQSRFTPVWRCFDSAIFNNRFEHLVLFGIKPFKGGLIETELLRHVLMNSPVLKKVELLLAYGVVYSLNEQEQQQMASIKVKKIKEDILKIPKASKEVEFVFFYDEGVKI